MAKEILYILHNHFDPVWRRCFDRPARKDGLCIRSYAEVEEHVINAWLALAPKGYTFDEGQAAIWRKYLERNPDKKTELQDLAAKGQLNVLLAGETVQDSVISSAEGLVRNFLVAMPLYRSLVGEDHPGLKIATLEDAFGNSPNMPQILRGVGAEVVCSISYKPVEGKTWTGIDGTTIPCLDHVLERSGGTFVYHPPCPSCKGEGCETCNQSGMKLSGVFVQWMRPGLESMIEKDADWIAATASTEEGLPDESVVAMVEELNSLHEGSCTIRFGTIADAYARCREELLAATEEQDGAEPLDLNPAMPGCMVSRIRMKQRIRSIAYKLVAAESVAATAAWNDGKPVAQPEELSEAWRNLVFCQFHDAVTGTHIDTAYTELMEMMDAAEQRADAWLAKKAQHSFALQEACPSAMEGETAASRKLEAASLGSTVDSPAELPLGNFAVTYDLRGILSIRLDGEDPWFQTDESGCDFRRQMRVGELTVEADFGDAWAKRWPQGSGISWDSSLVYLGDYHTSVETTPNAIRWRGEYTGGDPKIHRLAWTVTLRPSADGRALEFTTDVDWDTASRRLRVVVPVRSKDSTATFEVPFGHIDRTLDHEKISHGELTPDSQEFGALHWVRKDLGDGKGVALLNRGLPCHRYINGELDLSLLRSPEHCFSANLTVHYDFWDLEGLRDTGQHQFEYALLPYADGMSVGDLVRRGYDYNRPMRIEPPFRIKGDVVVTAWKPAENGEGWILRVQEAGGQGTEVTLGFDEPRTVTKTDLLERPQGEPVTSSAHTIPLHKHGILTVLITVE